MTIWGGGNACGDHEGYARWSRIESPTKSPTSTLGAIFKKRKRCRAPTHDLMFLQTPAHSHPGRVPIGHNIISECLAPFPDVRSDPGC